MNLAELMIVEHEPVRNPFATRHVRPGALAFVFQPGESAAALVDRLQRHAWRGEIVGPHGSGKSTLLMALLAELHDHQVPTILFTLHDGQRRLPVWPKPSLANATPPVVVVDGYEQLSLWSRWRLALRCRRQGWGLLVTAHEARGLPLLYRTESRLDTLRTLVARLDPGASAWLTDEDLRRHYGECRGDLRETLFALYDLHEQRARRALSPAES